MPPPRFKQIQRPHSAARWLHSVLRVPEIMKTTTPWTETLRCPPNQHIICTAKANTAHTTVKQRVDSVLIVNRHTIHLRRQTLASGLKMMVAMVKPGWISLQQQQRGDTPKTFCSILFHRMYVLTINIATDQHENSCRASQPDNGAAFRASEYRVRSADETITSRRASQSLHANQIKLFSFLRVFFFFSFIQCKPLIFPSVLCGLRRC